MFFSLFLNPQAGLRKGRVFPPCRKVITGAGAFQTLSGARHSPPPPSILSVAEARAVLAEAVRRPPRLAAYFAIALFAGLRPSATATSSLPQTRPKPPMLAPSLSGRNSQRGLPPIHRQTSPASRRPLFTASGRTVRSTGHRTAVATRTPRSPTS